MTTTYENRFDQNRLESNPEIKPYFYDINPGVAANAYNNTSQFPERASSLIRSDYALTLIDDLNEVKRTIRGAISRGATVDENTDALVDSWFSSYRSGLKQKYTAYLSAQSRVASAFICGPANFPVRSNQKKMDSADNRYEEINTFRYSQKKSILKTILPFGDGTEIRTNDPDAVDKLSSKVQSLESQRDRMKKTNATFRKFYKKGETPDPSSAKYNDCIEAITALGFSEPVAEKLISPNYMGRCVPFESYELTNLGANIRRLKERETSVAKTQSVEIDDTFPNGEKAYISDDGKIVIEFGYKPDESTRSVLKSNAFKWSRYRTAWVRKTTVNAINAYNYYVKPLLEAAQ